MLIKIKDSFVVEANSKRIQAYLLSKAMRKEKVTDAEIKKIYNLDEADFEAAVEKLTSDGVVDKE